MMKVKMDIILQKLTEEKIDEQVKELYDEKHRQFR